MIAPASIAIIFGIVLIVSAYLSVRRRAEHTHDGPPEKLPTLLKMNGAFPTPQGPQTYQVHAVPAGFGLMFVAVRFRACLASAPGRSRCWQWTR